MRLTISFCLLLLTGITSAQQVNIIPQPAVVKLTGEGTGFNITASTVIVLQGSGLEKTAAYLNDYLQKFYLIKLKVVTNSASTNAIRLNYERLEKEQPGAYIMTVDEKGIYIGGDNASGTFNGIQTLIQLLPVPDFQLKKPGTPLKIPFLYIEDTPRFAYRGMHLDVARHFQPVSFVKKYIDYLALHKINKFHWHLTEDQGWRIEIKKYPKLTQVGGWRNGTIIGRYPGTGNDKMKYGGFYTQEEIKEVVKYAADRYIDVIPEIEMPGHSSAAIAAYPQLSCFPEIPTINYFPKDCEWYGDKNGKQVQQTWGVFDDVFCAGNDSTFIFLENVLDEVLALFPSKYIHVGGDECPKENWKKCHKCQMRIKNEGLTDEHHLQSYFIQRMEKYLNDKGRILIGWDEILEGGLAPNAVVMSWRGETGGIEAAQQKHQVIMSPGNPVYFDHTQSENEDSVTIGGFNPLEKVYAYDPIPAKLQEPASQYVMGAQANVWTEYMKNSRKIEYMIFPRMSALSEVLWSQKENKSWEEYEKKLQVQFKRYDLWGVNYSKAYLDLKTQVIPSENLNGVIITLKSKYKGDYSYTSHYEKSGIAFTGNPGMYNFKDSVSIEISESGTFAFFLYPHLNPKVISRIEQPFSLNKATGKKITLTNPASDKYPGDGAFTLVNGVQNEKGFARSKEFLGFNGTDCQAIIDLGSSQSISEIKVHCLKRTSSWIWQPAAAEVFGSADGQSWIALKHSTGFITDDAATGNGSILLTFPGTSVRFIKVLVKNYGVIPAGSPGAGNKPWLFVDEIEVK